MNNNTVRFVNEYEMDLIKYLFSVDRKMVGVILDDQELEVRICKIRDSVSKNEMKIAMVFDETGNPYCMTTGFYMKKIGGWYTGVTKVYKSSSHFNLTARYMKMSLDLVVDHMESQGLYKFWMAAPEWQHNLRNKVMIKHSTKLGNYLWFDEEIIPQNQLSEFSGYDTFRYVCDWSDVTIRLFVLKQELRNQLIKGRYDKRTALLEQSGS